MKTNIIILIGLLTLMAFAVVTVAGIQGQKQQATQQKLSSSPQKTVVYPTGWPESKFISDMPCTVRIAGTPSWAVDNWLCGGEVFKVYQDVEELSGNFTYPFYVAGLAIEMKAASSGKINLQADIEELSSVNSTDQCPYPGSLLEMTDEYTFKIPGKGSVVLVIPFDEPVLVDGPYFGGMFFAPGTSLQNLSLVTDNNPTTCRSWNDWGAGFVDLTSNQYFDCPGNLVAYSFGWSTQGTSPDVPVTSR